MPLFMGGTFNNIDPVIGLPLYYWEWIVNIGLIIAIYFLLKHLWWTPHKPFHGLYYAFKNMSFAAFIADKNLVAEMVEERRAKCIFDYSKEVYEIDVPFKGVPVIGWFTENILKVPILGKLAYRAYTFAYYYPTKWLKNIDPITAMVYKFGGVNKDVEIAAFLQNGEWERYPSVTCGGVPVDIVVDTDSWTLPNTPQHLAIERTALVWNKENPKDQVHSYTKWQRYVTIGDRTGKKIICPPEVKVDFLVDWTRINAGFPMDLEEDDWAGKRRQMAIDKSKDRVDAKRAEMAFLVAGGGLSFAAFIVFIKVVIFFITYKPPT